MPEEHLLLDPGDDPAAVARAVVPASRIVDGFELPAEPWSVGPGLVCAGHVTDDAAAADALLCAARGALLVAAVSSELRGRFFEDLLRVGPVRRPTGVDAAPRVAGPLDEQQLGLLRLLAEGRSVREAGKALFLSQRTAERKLAQARAVLGVTTTAEAVVAAGALDAAPPG